MQKVATLTFNLVPRTPILHSRETKPEIYVHIQGFTNSLTLRMEVACSSYMSVGFLLSTRHYTLEDKSLHNHRCDNFETYFLLSIWLNEPKFVPSWKKPKILIRVSRKDGRRMKAPFLFKYAIMSHLLVTGGWCRRLTRHWTRASLPQAGTVMEGREVVRSDIHWTDWFNRFVFQHNFRFGAEIITGSNRSFVF
jgi:hypothetical protein